MCAYIYIELTLYRHRYPDWSTRTHPASVSLGVSRVFLIDYIDLYLSIYIDIYIYLRTLRQSHWASQAQERLPDVSIYLDRSIDLYI